MAEQKMTRTALLCRFLRGSFAFFLISIIASVVSNALDMIGPRLIRYTLDSVIGSEPSDLTPALSRVLARFSGDGSPARSLAGIAILILSVALLSGVFRYLNLFYNTKGAETLLFTMRRDLFSHIERLPYEWHMKNKTGDIIQRCTSDAETLRVFISDQLTSVVRIVILVVFTLCSIFTLNTRIGWIALASVPVIVGYSALFYAGFGKRFRDCDENEGVLSTIAQENLTGVRVVRAFGREEYERERFEKQNSLWTAMWVRVCRLLAWFWSIGDLISCLQILLMMSLGTVMAVRGEITAGTFVAIMTYNAMMTWPVRQLGRVISEMSKAGVSLDRIRTVMNEPVEADVRDACRPPMTGDIVFSHVTFAYDRSKRNILSDVSFTARGGKVFGILGSTGSGKSTLVALLDRLLDLPPDGGTISVGGTDIREIDRTWLRSQIGIVLQEPFLFSRTLGENITVTRDEYTEEELNDAVTAACLDEAVRGFTDGYDTVVGERGVTLSGGQKQRAAIARMLMMKTPVMILDDALSAVDAKTDAAIREKLSERFGDATVILISHRVSTLMNADCVMVLEGGKVAEMGTHDELMKSHGVYRRIYDLQTGGASDFSAHETSDTGKEER